MNWTKQQVAFRLPKNIVDALDQEAAALTKQMGFEVTRTDVVESALREKLQSRLDAISEEVKELGGGMLIEDVEMSRRSKVTLTGTMGLTHLGELCQYTEADLLKQKLVGRKTLNEIEAVLDSYGLKLKAWR